VPGAPSCDQGDIPASPGEAPKRAQQKGVPFVQSGPQDCRRHLPAPALWTTVRSRCGGTGRARRAIRSGQLVGSANGR
jgi:hypothetical protein